jgi:hypothetical protein
MYMHNNHCHRATAHLQLSILLYHFNFVKWTREGSDYDSVNEVRGGTEETLFAKITWFATDYAIYSKGIEERGTAFKTLSVYFYCAITLSRTKAFQNEPHLLLNLKMMWLACISCLSAYRTATINCYLFSNCGIDSTLYVFFFATRSKTYVSLYWCCPHFVEFCQVSKHRTSWSPRVILQVSQVQSHMCWFCFKMFRKVHWNVLVVNNHVHAWQS